MKNLARRAPSDHRQPAARPVRHDRPQMRFALVGAVLFMGGGITLAIGEAAGGLTHDVDAPAIAAVVAAVQQVAHDARAPAPSPVDEDADADATLLGRVTVDRIRAQETLSEALVRHRVQKDDVLMLVRDLKGALDVRSLRAGALYKIAQGPTNSLSTFEYATRAPSGVPRTVTATRTDGVYDVAVVDAPIETRIEAMGGEVRSSLYTAVVGDGGDANLVNRFVDVFAWNVDFYRQSQRGDSWKVVVEKHYAGGRFLGFGDVLAAEYVNAGHVHRGFKYTARDGKVNGIFDDEGQSLANAFLKSPLEIARITSSYGQRFHPVLHREKKHEGVDYGAATGTPFWAVADGVVKEARWSASAGNMLVVKHINGYETEYFHCSKFADGIKPGARVKQKQVIGYVGTTGRSTGPHLHFGMWKGGARVDPQKQKFVKQRGVPKDHAGEFQRVMQPLLELLKGLDIA